MQLSDNALWILHDIFCNANGRYDEPVDGGKLQSLALFILHRYTDTDFGKDIETLKRSRLVKEGRFADGKPAYFLTTRGLYRARQRMFVEWGGDLPEHEIIQAVERGTYLQMPMNDESRRIFALKQDIVRNFTAEEWQELGLVTNCVDYINNHDRLLRSLSFGDFDYGANVAAALFYMVNQEPGNLESIEEYVRTHTPGEATNISSVVPSKPSIAFTPSVFEIPVEPLDPQLVSVMMPFSGASRAVYEGIKLAASGAGFHCQRADDIWVHSAVIQDVFSLIYRSFIVVCDFTGKNPNVFYEAGIAHTLGKHVIPITQHLDDVPFDLRHHRVLTYLGNTEGYNELAGGLAKRFVALDTQR